MAFSTFTGPVRSGTVRYTTGTVPGLLNNTGVVSLSQSAPLALTSSVVAVIPAGSQIREFYIDVTTLFTTGATLSIGDGTTVDKYVTAITTPAVGRQSITFTSAQLTALQNVGTTDVAVTITMAGTTAIVGAGFFTVEYAQKSQLGAQNPLSA
jgi:hypothetical protein